MNPDILNLQDFYASAFGRLAEKSIRRALRGVCKPIPKERFAGLGFTVPWLEEVGALAEFTVSLMPARQGAAAGTCDSTIPTLLVSEENLPFSNSSLDRVLIVHTLEHSCNPRKVLNEVWRVLSPGGRVVIVAPNYYCMWNRLHSTPFGLGRSFSWFGLNHLLNASDFKACSWSGALFFFPFASHCFEKFESLKKPASEFLVFFSGVMVVEAKKQRPDSFVFRKKLFPVLSPRTHL